MTFYGKYLIILFTNLFSILLTCWNLVGLLGCQFAFTTGQPLSLLVSCLVGWLSTDVYSERRDYRQESLELTRTRKAEKHCYCTTGQCGSRPLPSLGKDRQCGCLSRLCIILSQLPSAVMTTLVASG